MLEYLGSIMATEKIHRFDLARQQLKTAVWMLLSGRDRFSAITLAGAASGILSQLVEDHNHESFDEYARRIYHHEIGQMPPRSKYRRHINQMLHVHALRHHSPEDDEHIEFDEEKSACNAVTKAIADYGKIAPENEDFVNAFYKWAWETQDGPKMMELYLQKVKDGGPH